MNSKNKAGGKRKVHLLTSCHPTTGSLIPEACPNLTPLLKVLDLWEGAYSKP